MAAGFIVYGSFGVINGLAYDWSNMAKKTLQRRRLMVRDS